MGTRSFETATSLERYLNRSVLFIQGIEANIPKQEVLQVLNQVLKQPQQGRIDILTTPDGKMRGTAFCNFHNMEDAKAALEKWRFTLELRGRPLRMQYSSDREFKDLLQGPLMARFKILIRNLPEELTQEALFDMFSQYGEVLQVHTNCDHYGQHYAIIQYVEYAAVQAAIRNAHRERVLSHVLLVEPYKPNVTYGALPRNINQLGPAPLLPPAPAPAGTGGSPSGGGAAGAGVLPGTTYAALQQQQEREHAEQERQAAAAGQQRHSEASGGAAAGTSNGGAPAADAAAAAGIIMAVPSFYASAAAAATGALHSPTAPGSLLHLLSTAVHHVTALEEHLCCPITQEPLEDPVVAADGNTYERVAIEAWLLEHDTSPLTNEVLPHKALTPNNLLRKIAEELKGISHPDADGGVDGAAAAGVADPPAAAAAEVEPVPVPVPVPLQQPQYQQPVQQQQHGVAPPPPPPQQQQQQQPASQPAPAQHYSQHQHQQQQQQQQHSQTHHVQHQQHQQHQQHHYQPHQQQYGEYGSHHAQVLRASQLVAAAPVTFVHTLQPPPPPQQPQTFTVQGTTYYAAYRPMGM